LFRAKADRIETAVIDHTKFGRDRDAFEHAMEEVLERQKIELVCLAGFMRLLTPWFVDRWRERMLNIHPALLPAFKGLDTHKRALEAGVKLHGATIHFVVPDMDSGPIVAQGALAVHDDDDEESLAARVIRIEHKLYALALRLVAEGRVRVVHGRCFTDGAPAPHSELLVP
jgi:phosphoribosylglycinamide formyltransferase-1